jgi:cytochrome c oxidase cbb3-type subunit 2
VEIVPLFFQTFTRTAVDHQGEALASVKPYDALRLAGRYVYIREGCYNCHSQMIRPFRAETERYGHFSVAGEFVYDHPFQWGSKRSGPDLARIGGRRDDEWHRKHLLNPRDVVPESNMPAFPWLDRPLSINIGDHMRAMNWTINPPGVTPYSDSDIAEAPAKIANKTELEALIAYLQGMGLAFSNVK